MMPGHAENGHPDNEHPEQGSAPSSAARLSRRDSLKWLAAMLAGGAVAGATGANRSAVAAIAAGDGAGHWPVLDLPAVTARGYGTDPKLVSPTRAPWPTTLTGRERLTVASLADILVPREGSVPSASELNVHDVVDEWISAPYAPQQADRMAVLSLLRWLDDEAKLRFGKSFGDIGAEPRVAIVDDIAWLDTTDEFTRPAGAFDVLRRIVLGAFYCTPEGRADLGYLGGQVIPGDYPGPTKEALAHLETVLEALDLEPYQAPLPHGAG